MYGPLPVTRHGEKSQVPVDEFMSLEPFVTATWRLGEVIYYVHPEEDRFYFDAVFERMGWCFHRFAHIPCAPILSLEPAWIGLLHGSVCASEKESFLNLRFRAHRYRTLLQKLCVTFGEGASP